MASKLSVNKTKIAKGKILFYACIVALPLLQFAIFYIGVNINSFVLAFQQWDSEKYRYVWHGL